MLQNAYLLAKIGADTAENERNFAKNWQLPYGSTTLRAEPGAERRAPRPERVLRSVARNEHDGHGCLALSQKWAH